MYALGFFHLKRSLFLVLQRKCPSFSSVGFGLYKSAPKPRSLRLACRAVPSPVSSSSHPSFSACEDMALLILQFSYGVVKTSYFIFSFPLLFACARRVFSCPSLAYTLPKCPSRVRATPTTTTRAKLGSRFPPPHAKAFFLGACSNYVHHRAFAV